MQIILYTICFIHWLSVESQMFTETTAALSSNWTGPGTLQQTLGYNQITNDAINYLICPGTTNDNCWDIALQGYVERTVNTFGYMNVELTYSMSSGYGLAGQEQCTLQYSTNAIDYTQIDFINVKNVDKSSRTFNTWTTVDNIPQLTIQLTNVRGGCHCYFNDLILSGSTATPTATPTTLTGNPTTSTPTTIPTTFNPTTSAPTTAIPTTATSTTSIPTTAIPTTFNPTTSAPTSNPTTSPSNRITIASPTSVTNTPTTDIPTTVNPTGSPTTDGPTNEPILSTVTPTNSPSNTSTSRVNNLHFICHYNDNKDYIIQFITLLNYANIMGNVILSSLQSINNELIEWKNVNIFDFTICNVFDTPLSNENIIKKCPLYLNYYKKAQYMAIGTFGIEIEVDDQLNVYKQWIIQQFESNELKNEITSNINNKLNNITLNTNSFEMIEIEIIDMNNTIISSIITTINDYNLSDGSNNKSDNNTIVIITVVIMNTLIVIITIVFILYFKKKNMKNNNNNNNIEEGEGEYIHNDIDNREGVEENMITQNKDIDDVVMFVINNIPYISDNGDKTINETVGIKPINDKYKDIETEYM